MSRPFPLNAQGFHPFAELIGLEVTQAGPGQSECRLVPRKELENPHRVLHGAVLYALADTGMGAALYPLLEEGELCATADLHISYFAPVTAGEIRCQSRVINKGKRLATLESEIRGGTTLLAKAMGTFAVFKPTGDKPGPD